MRETNKEAKQLIQSISSQLRICFKLAELEQEWTGIVGEEYAGRSSIAEWRMEQDCAVITLRASDAATAASMNFLKSRLSRMLKDYLELGATRVEIKVGDVKRRVTAKPPLPEWKRRAPVIVSDEAVANELEFTAAFCEDEKLAESFARLKALVERRKKRK